MRTAVFDTIIDGKIYTFIVFEFEEYWRVEAEWVPGIFGQSIWSEEDAILKLVKQLEI